MTTKTDPFKSRSTISTPLGDRVIYRLDAVRGVGAVAALPYTIKVLLEACLRNLDGFVVTEEHVKALASYGTSNAGQREIPFLPGRVILQDFTGVPAVVDLAAMRDAVVRMTGDRRAAGKVNPLVPCDLVIDHSVQVDAFASGAALTINCDKEFERNDERYRFLKWGQAALDNFRVVPPATGIVHQVNLEYLAKVVWDGAAVSGQVGELYPDSLIGTDSHTTMINGLGVVGWGVGGIEAEAVMLGQPIYMLVPDVVGFRLSGELAGGCTATDLVLRVTEMLRAHGVVGCFVEFFGDGLANMPLANRATIANMAPEYGATMGFFPVDDQTLKYLRLTGRDETMIETVKLYCMEQGLWRDDGHDIAYTDVLELDLGSVEPSLAGPRRPQDRIPLSAMKSQWDRDLSATFGKSATERGPKCQHGFNEGHRPGPEATAVANLPHSEAAGIEVTHDGRTFRLEHGAVVIAAITSCTNTSNPEVMIAAGLLARNAHRLGLNRKPWVKTSLAPGSKVVTEYYKRAGLMQDLEALGFHLVGYGCTTCIGNSGPLPEAIATAIRDADLIAASVLSGNRNFEGRINPDTRANYLASPPLVVAYAIAGTVDVDLIRDPIGTGSDGQDVFLSQIWPGPDEIQATIARCISRDQFVQQYRGVFEGSEQWKAIPTSDSVLFEWDEQSTYVRQPPFFVGLPAAAAPIEPIAGARCLVKLGDSVTTDHISPAGSIDTASCAGRYLIDQGVPVSLFNSYGSRRGNHEVMMRGTFANIRVRNQMVPGTEGGYTVDFTVAPSSPAPPGPTAPPGRDAQSTAQSPGSVCFIYDAAIRYQAARIPLIVLAGRDYGMGSSRDWAAKGTFLLGVKAVLAASFERIHRSNLVGMGVLPLQFKAGQTHESLGLDGNEIFDIAVSDSVQPGEEISVTATKADGSKVHLSTTCRIDTTVEVDYYRNGGILHTVLRKMAKN